MNINAIYKKAVNNGYEVKTVTTNSGKYAIKVELKHNVVIYDRTDICNKN